MSMIGAGGKAVHHKVEQPRQADAHRTANPTEGDTLAQQIFNILTACGRNEAVCGAGTQLTFALFTQMILFAMAGMTIFLTPCGSALWARLWDNHCSLLTSVIPVGDSHL